MSAQVRMGGMALALGVLALLAAGCGDVPQAGSIEAPVLNRAAGPTTDPNLPGAESVIPSEDRVAPKKSGRSK